MRSLTFRLKIYVILYSTLTCICTGCVGIDIGIGCAAETATIDPGAAEPGGTCIGCPVGTMRVGVRFIGGPTGVTPWAGTETIFGSTTVGAAAATCATSWFCCSWC